VCQGDAQSKQNHSRKFLEHLDSHQFTRKFQLLLLPQKWGQQLGVKFIECCPIGQLAATATVIGSAAATILAITNFRLKLKALQLQLRHKMK